MGQASKNSRTGAGGTASKSSGYVWAAWFAIDADDDDDADNDDADNDDADNDIGSFAQSGTS